MVTYLNTRYPLESPLVAWETTAAVLQDDFQKLTGRGAVSGRDLRVGQFAPWLREQFARLPRECPVVIYLSSHQEKNGDWRFKDGRMPLAQIVRVLTDVIGSRPALVINDSCHAGAWERIAWPENMRLVLVSGRDELNESLHMRNDSPAMEKLYRRKIGQFRDQKRDLRISYFGLLWLGPDDAQANPAVSFSLNPAQWSKLRRMLHDRSNLLQREVRRVKLPKLLFKSLPE
ncbi:hypothetical protein QPK87_23295 [Kamptonema cortianum]|nr:hypothetical protein [Kamptonema cortianum]